MGHCNFLLHLFASGSCSLWAQSSVQVSLLLSPNRFQLWGTEKRKEQKTSFRQWKLYLWPQEEDSHANPVTVPLSSRSWRFWTVPRLVYSLNQLIRRLEQYQSKPRALCGLSYCPGVGGLFFSFPVTSSLITAQHLKLGNGREEHGFFLNPCDLRASPVSSPHRQSWVSIAEERTEPSFLPLYFLKSLTMSLWGKRHACVSTIVTWISAVQQTPAAAGLGKVSRAFIYKAENTWWCWEIGKCDLGKICPL